MRKPYLYLSIFTPKEEVDLCGHIAIGSFAILMQFKNKLFRNRYTIETNIGVLTITIKDDIIFMEQDKAIFYDVISPKEFIDYFDIKAIDNKYPIQIVSTGLKDILIPIKNMAAATSGLCAKLEPYLNLI